MTSTSHNRKERTVTLTYGQIERYMSEMGLEDIDAQSFWRQALKDQRKVALD